MGRQRDWIRSTDIERDGESILAKWSSRSRDIIMHVRIHPCCRLLALLALYARQACRPRLTRWVFFGLEKCQMSLMDGTWRKVCGELPYKWRCRGSRRREQAQVWGGCGGTQSLRACQAERAVELMLHPRQLRSGEAHQHLGLNAGVNSPYWQVPETHNCLLMVPAQRPRIPPCPQDLKTLSA